MTNQPFPLDPKPVPNAQDMKIARVLYVLFALVLAGVLVANYMGAFGSLHSDGGDNTPAKLSPTARCEQAWTENRDNQYNMARTKSEYMTNCVDLQKTLDQIKRDHQ